MLALADQHRDLDRIVHLAAQPGVRHSLVDPYVYVQTNVMGHLVMLELARAAAGPEALRLCVVLVGLWRQPQAALRDRRPGRPAGVALCRHQARATS